MSTDMRSAIEPKSTQLNADDLISGPRTITITGVKVSPGVEQPVSVSFDGDNGKPYLPCKSMARVLVYAWGPDAKQYTGRSLTLYRDPDVTWAGMKVGGIRISHMSHIERDHTMALTVTKQSRKPFTVKPLAVDKNTRAPATPPPADPPATAAAEPPEPVEKRGKEIAVILRDHGNSAANLSWSWQQNEAEIMSMPGPAQRGLRKVYEAEMAKISIGDVEPKEKDGRQKELV